ncbi:MULTISPECIES: hypothetical protein [Rhodopirellula]|uniref:hypothetical protein n=1 Tax=Rhodopirellula TaxID=265488 RepID=UPI00326779CD
MSNLLDVFLNENVPDEKRLQCSAEITRSLLLWPTNATFSADAEQLTMLRRLCHNSNADRQIRVEGFEVIAGLSTRVEGLKQTEAKFWGNCLEQDNDTVELFFPTLLLYTWSNSASTEARKEWLKKFLDCEACTESRLVRLCSSLESTYKTKPYSRRLVIDFLVEIGLSDTCSLDLAKEIFRIIGGIRLLDEALETR